MIIWISAALLIWATPAAAADGAIEINQAKALAGGVTPGDSAGFPVQITQPGSYRLTGNLDRTGVALSTRTIDITSADVTLDLGGFEIRGGAVCTGTPVTSCTNTGTGDGIAAIGADGVTIRNGTVRGMPRSGVRITGEHSRVEGVTAISNGLNGIDVTHGMVVDSVGSENFEDGISSSGTVQRCVTRFNRLNGFSVVAGLILNSMADSNGAYGLATSNTLTAYGQNLFICNNSAGLCNNVAQVSNATAIEIAANQCGIDTVCP
jgi:hypothetical protein